MGNGNPELRALGVGDLAASGRGWADDGAWKWVVGWSGGRVVGWLVGTEMNETDETDEMNGMDG